MFQIMEMTGVSETSYEDAIASVIRQLNEDGFAVHFFKVAEMRGSVSTQGIIQYQIILSIAVEYKSKMSHSDSLITSKAGKDEITCDWCGCVIIPPSDYTEDFGRKTIVCNSCGRIVSHRKKTDKTKLK